MSTAGSWSWTKSLERVGKALRTFQEAETPLQLIVEEIAHGLGCQTCAIILRDEKSGQYRIRHHYGLSHTFAKSFAQPFEVGAFKEVMWTGEPLIVEDADLAPELEADTRLEKPYKSGFLVRIHANHSRFGYLHVDFQKSARFSPEDVEIVQLLADLGGVAILKTRLLEENLKLNPLDPHTGLLRYSHFVAKLESYLAHAKAVNENFAVIIFDVDHYGDLVNMYGGQRASAAFQKICAEVSRAISPFDAASRYGLDEVIVFLSSATPEQASALAERICRETAEHRFPEVGMEVTMSGGIATFPHHGGDLSTLIASASRALFETQRVRRNAVFSLERTGGIILTEEVDQEKFRLTSE
ncbi:MAG: sensor domain-containing diguanylate cyclase [Bacteroidota bacterium]